MDQVLDVVVGTEFFVDLHQVILFFYVPVCKISFPLFLACLVLLGKLAQEEIGPFHLFI